MLGFHLAMNESAAAEDIAKQYMLLMELLMIFTAIRLLWDSRDKSRVSNTLFIKDGPMMIHGQYAKLVPNIREFFRHSKTQGRPVHIISSEKSGDFFDHLQILSRNVTCTPGELRYAVLSHGYTRDVIQRIPDRGCPYGLRTNWGEKLFVCVDDYTHMVLNIPTGEYIVSDDYPDASDLIGLDRILATLPQLISRQYEGALYPLELANDIASMSVYPSARILSQCANDLTG